MARVSPKQHRFSRGQISKKLQGSQDLELYFTALEICRNYIVDGRGILERRPGTRLRWRTKNDGAAILLPFAYDQKQAYVLEMGAGYLRAGFNGGLILSGGSPFEISTPYTLAQLKELSTHSINDLMWAAHKAQKLQAITRTAIDAFSIAEFKLRDGPYLDPDTSSTTLTPDSRGALVPNMSSNVTADGTASDSDGSANAYKVFDGDLSSVGGASGSQGFIQLDLAGSTTQVVDAYYLVAPSKFNRMPTAWTIQGWDGSNWTVLDSRVGESDWGDGEKRTYSFKNVAAYSKYRIFWTASLATDNDNSTTIAELAFNIAGDYQTPFDLTASSTTGINNGTGFQTTDVGRAIRILGSDNIWRYFIITSRTSSTVVKVRLYGPPVPDKTRISTWRIGAFSAGNYSACVTLHENRLCLSVGNRVFMSTPNDYTNFSPTQPDGSVIPDNAITVVIPSFNSKRGAVSDVTILKSTDFQLFVGTGAGNFTIQSNSFGDGITPDNVTCRPQEGRGAGRLDPEIIGSSIIYIHNTGKKLMGTYQKDNSRIGAQDLSLPADDLAERGIVWTAYQEAPHGVLWAGFLDGTMAGFTVQPEEKVQAWHEHPLGGRFVSNSRVLPAQAEWGCVVPGDSGKRDDLYLIAKRTIGGQTRRFVESLEPYWTIGRDLKTSFFVDGGLQYTGNQNAAAVVSVTAGGPLDVRTITTANCPAFVAGTILSVHDGVRWHRGRILTVDGSNNLTWRPIAPNDYAAPPDGSRWHYIDGAWVQLADGVKFDIFALTYVDLAQRTGINTWSVGITTLTGLADYEGAMVDILVDGFYLGKKLVTSGQITGIPEGTVIAAGFHEPTKGKLLSIEAGSQSGSAQDRQRPVYEAGVQVLESSRDLEAGTGMPSAYGGVWEYYAPMSSDVAAVNQLIEGEPLPAKSATLHSTRDENYDINNPAVAWRQPSPLPSFVLGIITRLNESDGK